MMAELELIDITKLFGEQYALNGVSVTIAAGEFVSLVGPSGCGKSTLLKIVAGLTAPDDGEVFIRGERATNVEPSSRNVAMVFQNYALYPHLSAQRNIAMPLAMQKLGLLTRWSPRILQRRFAPHAVRQIDEAVLRAADMLRLRPYLDKKPGQLSGGQQQRVALARAIVRQPVAFLLDEPLSNLDAQLRVHLRAELAALHRTLEATILFVTHDQEEAMLLSDRIIVMRDGTVQQIGTPAQIYGQPANLFVAGFIGAPQINLAEVPIRQAGTVRAFGAEAVLEAGIPDAASVTVGVRPEHVLISAPDQSAEKARIERLETNGPTIYVHLSVAGLQRPLVARLEGDQQLPLAKHQIVGVSVRPDRLLLFGKSGRLLAQDPSRRPDARRHA
ncbi:MAG: ABC transporter ATP-binding protein [Pseudomonadota bacterium]